MVAWAVVVTSVFYDRPLPSTNNSADGAYRTTISDLQAHRRPLRCTRPCPNWPEMSKLSIWRTVPLLACTTRHTVVNITVSGRHTPLCGHKLQRDESWMGFLMSPLRRNVGARPFINVWRVSNCSCSLEFSRQLLANNSTLSVTIILTMGRY